METVELGTALQSILKDNANPANLLGLNGNDITKSTMQQVAQVAGGLKIVVSGNGRGHMAKIYEAPNDTTVSSFQIIRVDYSGEISFACINVRTNENGRSIISTNLTSGNKITVYRSTNFRSLYLNLSDWDRYVLIDILGSSEFLKNEKVDGIDVNSLVEVSN